MEFFIDFLAHQAWADAKQWSVIEAHPAASTDQEISKRLHHFHLTQYAFITILRGEEFVFSRMPDFPDLKSLKEFVMHNHSLFASYGASMNEADLSKKLDIPWFKKPPLEITVSQALLQVCMHSQYHRGQNARRLRELGCDPPSTDLIVWYWQTKPVAEW